MPSRLPFDLSFDEFKKMGGDLVKAMEKRDDKVAKSAEAKMRTWAEEGRKAALQRLPKGPQFKPKCDYDTGQL